MSERPIDNDLADSIAMLEQILEVMPQDMIALKALYNAYAQADRMESAFEYLGRLAEAAIDKGELEIGAFVQRQLGRFEDERPDPVGEIRSKLKELSGKSVVEASSTETPEEVADHPGSIERDINEELALAWRLYEENQLSQEEYSSVLHDLTEMSSKQVDVPVSVLHVLNDRGFTQMTRIMNYISTRSNVPFLSLMNFDIDKKVAHVVPVEVASRDGALPLAFVGEDLLVGVLNPYHHLLVDRVERLAERRCHSFLVGPEEYDKGLAVFKEAAASEA